MYSILKCRAHHIPYSFQYNMWSGPFTAVPPPYSPEIAMCGSIRAKASNVTVQWYDHLSWDRKNLIDHTTSSQVNCGLTYWQWPDNLSLSCFPRKLFCGSTSSEPKDLIIKEASQGKDPHLPQLRSKSLCLFCTLQAVSLKQHPHLHLWSNNNN